MYAVGNAAAPVGKIVVVMTKGFVVPCLVYLMIGLALYPQLGVIASLVGVSMRGQPSEVEWLFGGFYFMLLGMTGVFVHEMGHALVIKYRHRGRAVIALSAQVGTRHAAFEGSSRIMALSGPALQFAYGAAVLAICIPTQAFYFGILSCYIIVDALYNLLPFPNYDGYHIFRKQKNPCITDAGVLKVQPTGSVGD